MILFCLNHEGSHNSPEQLLSDRCPIPHSPPPPCPSASTTRDDAGDMGISQACPHLCETRLLKERSVRRGLGIQPHHTQAHRTVHTPKHIHTSTRSHIHAHMDFATYTHIHTSQHRHTDQHTFTHTASTTHPHTASTVRYPTQATWSVSLPGVMIVLN